MSIRFRFEGREFSSGRQFCREFQLSYWRWCRIRRHYLRARRDPAIAALWMLTSIPHGEAVTLNAERGRLFGRMRTQEYRLRKRNQLKRKLLRRR